MSELSPDRVYMRDIRASRMCAYGARQFFVKHGWDWSTFLREGISLSTVAAARDAMADKVVRFVKNGRV